MVLLIQIVLRVKIHYFMTNQLGHVKLFAKLDIMQMRQKDYVRNAIQLVKHVMDFTRITVSHVLEI